MKERNFVQQTLASIDLKPSKRKGQNFLLSTARAQQIVEFANLRPGQAVVEIGPGLGALTEVLLPKASRLIAVEIEPRCCSFLKQRFPALQDSLICSDFRKVDLSTLLNGQPSVVVSNVPYSVSSALILWLFQQRENITAASLLLQQEFAERLAAPPGTRARGSLTLLRECYAAARLGPVLKGEEFFPPAEVDSQLIELRFHQDAQPDALFEQLVRAAFSHKRKTVANCLGSSKLFVDKPQAVTFLQQLGIDPQLRAEQLTFSAFQDLTKAYREQFAES